MHCENCHMEIFYVSRSAPITRADHRRRSFCFVCHDGKRAFAARMNCTRCHEEPVVPRAEPLRDQAQNPVLSSLYGRSDEA